MDRLQNGDGLLLFWRLLLIEVILAPGATEHGIGTTGNKHLMAVAAQLHRLLFIRQQKAEHHVDGKHQGMEIPNNRGLFVQGNVVCRFIKAKVFRLSKINCFISWRKTGVVM